LQITQTGQALVLGGIGRTK